MTELLKVEMRTILTSHYAFNEEGTTYLYSHIYIFTA